MLDKKMFVSYKRGTNLKNILVHRKTKMLGRHGSTSQGNCGKNYCVCKLIYNQEDKIRDWGRVAHVGTNDRTTGCRSRNVIYGILCEVCNCGT